MEQRTNYCAARGFRCADCMPVLLHRKRRICLKYSNCRRDRAPIATRFNQALGLAGNNGQALEPQISNKFKFTGSCLRCNDRKYHRGLWKKRRGAARGKRLLTRLCLHNFIFSRPANANSKVSMRNAVCRARQGGREVSMAYPSSGHCTYYMRTTRRPMLRHIFCFQARDAPQLTSCCAFSSF